MDGTLAVIFAVASLTDMALNDCPTGCLAASDAATKLSFQAGSVIFQDEQIGQEIYLGYDLGRRIGPWQPTVGASITDQGDLWVGAGAKWNTSDIIGGPVFVEASLMPGMHVRGDGPDLGGNMHFRSALGAGYRFDNGATLFVSYDHRSNADTLGLNPGMETISIRYAIALE